MITNVRLDDHTDLRMLELRDAPEFLALIDHSRANISEYLPWVDRVNTLDDARAWIQQRLDKQARGEHITYGIWHDHIHAGGVMFRSIDHDARECEIGYWLDDAFVGRGLMSAACQWMIAHAFGELALDHILIQCAARNVRSRAVPERLGFTLEHSLPDDFTHRGVNHDSVVYGKWRN